MHALDVLLLLLLQTENVFERRIPVDFRLPPDDPCKFQIDILKAAGSEFRIWAQPKGLADHCFDIDNRGTAGPPKLDWEDLIECRRIRFMIHTSICSAHRHSLHYP